MQVGREKYCPLASIVIFLILAHIAISPTVSAQNIDSGWILLGTDPDEGRTFDLKQIYYKVEGNLLYIKIVFYRQYTSLTTFDIHIFLDVDDNVDTGYYMPNRELGADYSLYIGNDGYYRYGTLSFIWKSLGRGWDTSNPIFAEYEYYSFPSDTTIVCYDLSKLEGVGNRIRAIFIDTSDYPIYDYFPETGNIVMELIPEKLVEAKGVSTSGLAKLTLEKDSGVLKIYPYPWLGDKLPYEFEIKIISITRTEACMIINIQMNYNIHGKENWLPAIIIVDLISNKLFLIGPINMIGNI